MNPADPPGGPLPAPAAVYADHQDASPPLSPPHVSDITSGPLRPAIETVLEGALTGAGFTFWTMVAVVGLSAIRITLAAMVAPAYDLLGVWWMLALTAMARAAVMTALWHWGGWRKAAA